MKSDIDKVQADAAIVARELADHESVRIERDALRIEVVSLRTQRDDALANVRALVDRERNDSVRIAALRGEVERLQRSLETSMLPRLGMPV